MGGKRGCLGCEIWSPCAGTIVPAWPSCWRRLQAHHSATSASAALTLLSATFRHRCAVKAPSHGWSWAWCSAAWTPEQHLLRQLAPRRHPPRRLPHSSSCSRHRWRQAGPQTGRALLTHSPQMPAPAADHRQRLVQPQTASAAVSAAATAVVMAAPGQGFPLRGRSTQKVSTQQVSRSLARCKTASPRTRQWQPAQRCPAAPLCLQALKGLCSRPRCLPSRKQQPRACTWQHLADAPARRLWHISRPCSRPAPPQVRLWQQPQKLLRPCLVAPGQMQRRGRMALLGRQQRRAGRAPRALPPTALRHPALRCPRHRPRSPVWGPGRGMQAASAARLGWGAATAPAQWAVRMAGRKRALWAMRMTR